MMGVKYKKSLFYLFVMGLVSFAYVWAMYTNRFEGAKHFIDGNRRIPLWYPYDLSEFQFGQNVILVNWEDRTNGVLWKCSTPSDMSKFDAALLRPEGIEEFQMRENVVCGKRVVRDMNTMDVLGTRYFLFATNLVSMKYFESDVEFLEECGKYGINRPQLDSFDVNFNRFWTRDGRATPSRIVKSLYRTGLSKGEMIFLIFLTILWYYIIKGIRTR